MFAKITVLRAATIFVTMANKKNIGDYTCNESCQFGILCLTVMCHGMRLVPSSASVNGLSKVKLR